MLPGTLGATAAHIVELAGKPGGATLYALRQGSFLEPADVVRRVNGLIQLGHLRREGGRYFATTTTDTTPKNCPERRLTGEEGNQGAGRVMTAPASTATASPPPMPVETTAPAEVRPIRGCAPSVAAPHPWLRYRRRGLHQHRSLSW